MSDGNGKQVAELPALDGVKALLNAASRVVEIHAEAEKPNGEGVPDAVVAPRAVLRKMRDAIDQADAALQPEEPKPAWRTVPELREEAALLAAAPRIPLGLPGLDEILGGGILPACTCILGAFTSGGKTSVCEYEAIALSTLGHPVLYVTAELSPVEIAARVGALGGDLPALSIMPAEGDIFRVLGDVRRWIDDRAGSERCPVVIVDYLQRLRAPDDKGRERQVAVCAEELQTFGRKTGAVVIAAAQLNRKSKEVEPEIHHLRESGLIEQVADVALLLAKVDQGILRVKVGKNRHGRSGDVVDLSADWERLAFGPLAQTNLDGITGASKPAQDGPRARVLRAIGQVNAEQRRATTYDELAGLLTMGKRSIQEHVRALAAVGAARIISSGGGRGKPAEIFPAAPETMKP